jgi:hypothetical protein
MFSQTTQPLTAPNSTMDAALANFGNHPPLSGTVSSSTQIQGQPTEEGVQYVQESDAEETNVAEEAEQTEEVSEETEVGEEETVVSEGFAAEFKNAFGIEPSEAIETFNQLTAFRDEVRLMGEWNVTPSEYQSRMSQVKEFYSTLPEEGKAQFNTVEGAVSIWNYLQQNPGAAPKANKASVKPAGKTKKAPKAEIINKSSILRMNEQEYRANAGRIAKAFAEGRVREDL